MGPGFRSQSAAVSFVLLLALRAALAQQPTVSVSSTEVFVDVTVTGQSGAPIHGLTAADFRILEDGKPMPIRSFRRVDPTLAPTISGLDRIPLPPNTYLSESTIDAAAPVNVIYVDLGPREALPSTAYFRKQLIDFFRSKPAGAQFALFVGRDRPHMLQGFTSDHQQLLDALLAQKFLVEGGRALPYDNFTAGNDASNLMRRSYAALLDMQFGRGGWGASMLPSQSGASRDDAFHARREACTSHMNGLLNLALYLSQVPGRKNVFWVTSPFELSASTLWGSFDCTNELTQDAALLNVTHTAVFGFDIRPLNSFDSLDVANNTPPGVYDHRDAVFKQVAEDNTLNLISDQTGGHAFYNLNNFDKAMSDALARGAHYYAFTYSTSEPSPTGKFHAIRVELQKTIPGVTLSYRRGYWSIKPPKPTLDHYLSNLDEHLAYGLQYGAPVLTDLLFWARLQTTFDPADPAAAEKKKKSKHHRGEPGPQTVRVHFSLVPATFNPSLDYGNQVDVLYGVAAFDADGKRIAQKFARVRGEHTKAILDDINNQGLQFPAYIDIPAGGHSIRVVACTVARAICGSMPISIAHITTDPSFPVSPAPTPATP